jgi:ubiquinone/menaquinone biosynthesis C-methylase UbiE
MGSKIKQKSEWDDVAGKWNKMVGESGMWHQKHDIDPIIFKLLGSIKNKRIIEIGCGNGYLSRRLAKRGGKVTAIDLSSKFIKLAVGRERIKPLGVVYLVRDAAYLSGLKNNYFDIAVVDMSLMDIANVERAIKEIAKVLKPKGVFIFSITHPINSDWDWTILKVKGKKRFGKFVYRYLRPFGGQVKFHIDSILMNLTQYHRPIGAYIAYLRGAGLWIDKFGVVE